MFVVCKRKRYSYPYQCICIFGVEVWVPTKYYRMLQLKRFTINENGCLYTEKVFEFIQKMNLEFFVLDKKSGL